MLAVTPGQDTLYVLGRTLGQGKGAGIASIAGILTGALGHLLAGAAGLSAVLVASPMAFNIVKWAGSIYLIYLGIRSLAMNPEADGRAFSLKEGTVREVWGQGVLTNVLNPKVALFCLAFIPQFIVPEAPHKALPFLLLGTCFFFIGGAWLLLLVAFASIVGERLKEGRGWGLYLNRLAGGLFIALAVRMLLQRY